MRERETNRDATDPKINFGMSTMEQVRGLLPARGHGVQRQVRDQERPTSQLLHR